MGKEKPEYTLDAVTKIAQETTLVKGQHVPMLLVEGHLDTLILSLDELADSSSERAQQLFVIGMLMAKGGQVGVLQQVFFVSEGWMNTAQGEQSTNLKPSQDPERKEILLVSQQQVEEKETNMALLEMKRDKKGRLRSLEPFQKPIKQTQVQSPLLDAFVHGFLGLARRRDD